MAKQGYTTADPNDIRMLKPFPPPGTPAEAMHMPYSSPTNIADANGADIQEIQQLHEAKWPQSARDAHKASGGFFAGSGTSFPLKDSTDVSHAAQLYGHSSDPAGTKSKIIGFAKSHGFTSSLPKEWTEDIDDGDGYGDPQIQEGSSEIRQLCRIIEAQTLNEAGHEVRVTILQGGKSANGYSYDPLALQSVAQMVEGAQAYADHGPPDETVRSVRDIVGFYRNASYVPASGLQAGRVEADLHIVESQEWLWDIIKESFQAGQPNLIGLSIDIFGQYQFNQSLGAKEVTRIVSLNSCDIVTRPSAGGSFQRILHHDQGKGDTRMPPEVNTQETQQQSQTPPAEQQQQTQQNQTTPPAQQQASSEQIQETISKSNDIVRRMQEMEALNTRMIEQEQKLKMQESQFILKQSLAESILPTATKKKIEAKFADRVFEASELQNEMTSMLDMMAELAKDGLVRGHGLDKMAITSGQITEAEKVAAAVDMLFDLEIDQKFGKLPRFTGIREAYEVITGGQNPYYGISSQAALGNIRVSEHAPMGWGEERRIQEADTTTASFAYLLGTSMNKRLMKDYQAWPAEWQKFTVIAPIRDFKQQTRVRLGAFNSLSIVAEDSAYTTQTIQDSAATYVPQKRGNIVSVTRETIINDDLQAIKQIPTKLAVAAAYTIAEFVYSFLHSNPTIYDGTALFAAGHGNNNGSSSLSTAAMQSGVTVMREQQNFAGKRIGIRPRFLVVPPELEWNAMICTQSAGVPGSNNNDINPMLGYVTPIVSPQLTSTTEWYLAADPREVDTIEVGFVGGQVNPVLLIQDSPLLGLNFTNDVISKAA